VKKRSRTPRLWSRGATAFLHPRTRRVQDRIQWRRGPGQSRDREAP